MDRIEELKREIELKNEELKALKGERHLNFDDYNNFGGGKYGGYSIGASLCAELRSLATRIVSIREVTRTYDGSKYITAKNKPKTAEMTQEQISFCNDFLRELYPVIEKYAKIILDKNKEE